jgi:alpha-ketoglutarate-dependent taurine dioxygenase
MAEQVSAARPRASSLPDRIDSATVWQAADLAARPWRTPIDSATLAELDRIAGWLAKNPEAEVESLRLEQFDCPRMARTMAGIRAALSQGCGFAVLTEMPFERWDERTARAISWLLCHCVAAPVMQKYTGTRVYDVRDTGAQLGHGVRRSLTNLKQDLHTDGPWLASTADFMALACVRQATSGGMSRIASLTAAHEWLYRTRPELLERLYASFWWDRQAEHEPGDRPANFLPVFSWDGSRLRVRYYDDYIRSGQRLMETPLDACGTDALAAMREFVEAPENCFEFTLDRGQIFFLNNHLIAHGRTAFEDTSPGDRLLLRYWLRPHGGVEFEI